MVILIATSNHIYTYLNPHGVATSLFAIPQLRPFAFSLTRIYALLIELLFDEAGSDTVMD